MRRGADARLDKAGRIDREDDGLPAGRDLHAARRESRTAVAGALGEGRKADAEIAALARACFCRARNAGTSMALTAISSVCFVACLVVNQAGRRCVGKFVYQVAAPDIDRVQPQGIRRLVHQALEREGNHRPRHAAIGRHTASVGDDAARAAFVMPHVIRSRHLRHRHQRLHATSGGEAGIGADIGDDICLEREQFAVGVERAFQRHVLVARMKAGDQILAPVLGPSDHALEFSRQPHQHGIFGGERHFLPEAAADVGRDHAQVRLRHAEQVGDGGAREVRHLRGAGQCHAAGRGVIGGVAGTRLHRRRVLAVRARFDFDNFMRAIPDHVEVGRFESAFDDDVARRFGVHLGCAAEERRARIDNRGRFRNRKLNQVGDVFRFFLARRHHGGDRFADKPHDAGGQDRLADRLVVELVQHRRDFLHALEIGGSEDHRVLRRANVHDFSSRHRAAHKAHPMRCGEIGGEAPLAGDQRGIFQAANGAADPLEP